MASYFGARDFGDPRHNRVPMIMEREKRTGVPCVPPLWAPKAFPGQVSYPVLHNDRIPGIAGVRRNRHDRRFVSPRGSQSARATLQSVQPPTAAPAEEPSQLPPPPPPLTDRPVQPMIRAPRVSFDAATKSRAAPSKPQSSARGRAPKPSAARRPLLGVYTRSGDEVAIDDFTANGVAELVKLGFPPRAALAAFVKANYPAGSRRATPTAGVEADVNDDGEIEIADVVQYI